MDESCSTDSSVNENNCVVSSVILTQTNQNIYVFSTNSIYNSNTMGFINGNVNHLTSAASSTSSSQISTGTCNSNLKIHPSLSSDSKSVLFTTTATLDKSKKVDFQNPSHQASFCKDSLPNSFKLYAIYTSHMHSETDSESNHSTDIISVNGEATNTNNSNINIISSMISEESLDRVSTIHDSSNSDINLSPNSSELSLLSNSHLNHCSELQSSSNFISCINTTSLHPCVVKEGLKPSGVPDSNISNTLTNDQTYNSPTLETLEFQPDKEVKSLTEVDEHVNSTIHFPKNNKILKRRGGWPKGKRRKPIPNLDIPKAFKSAYVFFAIERRNQIKDSNPDIPFTEVTKIMGHEWSNLSVEQKKKFVDLAEADKKRYIEDLKKYEQTDGYKEMTKKKLLREFVNDGAMKALSESINSNEEDGLYCKLCNQYFSSVYNRKEHILGKHHLQNITIKINKIMDKNKKEKNPSENTSTECNQAILPDSCEKSEDKSPLNITGFLQDFIDKNNVRDQEMKFLKHSQAELEKKSIDLNKQVQVVGEQLSKIETHLFYLKNTEASIMTQIDSLRMVPMLFGVINF